MSYDYEVVIVGGGSAGLAAALALGRARRSVLVIDSGTPRNAPATHVHNYLGRESTPPSELIAIGREEVATYGGQFASGTVSSARAVNADGAGFQVALTDGQAVSARRLLVTTGLADELPGVPGVAERWGRDVLHCPYCHGWEVRDQRIGVLASGPLSVHQALLFRQWSSDVTLLLHTRLRSLTSSRSSLPPAASESSRGPWRASRSSAISSSVPGWTPVPSYRCRRSSSPRSSGRGPRCSSRSV
jgi:thioredoxin reductase